MTRISTCLLLLALGCASCGVGAQEIGKVIRDNALRIQYKGSAVIDSSLDALRDAWGNSLERILKVH